MFENLPVRVSFVCTDTTIGSFADLTSSDGRKHIASKGFRHYLICCAPRIIFDNFDRTQKKVAMKVQRDVTEFERVSIDIETSIKANGVLTEIEHIGYTKYPEIKVTLSNGAEFKFANCFEFLCTVAPKKTTCFFLRFYTLDKLIPRKIICAWMDTRRLRKLWTNI